MPPRRVFASTHGVTVYIVFVSAAALKWTVKQDKARGRRGRLQRSRAGAMTEDTALHAVRDHDRMLRRGSVRQSKNTCTNGMYVQKIVWSAASLTLHI